MTAATSRAWGIADEWACKRSTVASAVSVLAAPDPCLLAVSCVSYGTTITTVTTMDVRLTRLPIRVSPRPQWLKGRINDFEANPRNLYSDWALRCAASLP